MRRPASASFIAPITVAVRAGPNRRAPGGTSAVPPRHARSGRASRVVGVVCVCHIACSARGRPATSPAPTAAGETRRSRHAQAPSGVARSPAAAEPDGFRVAHCQGTEGRTPREVVKPRAKSSSDLARNLPTAAGPRPGGGAAGIRTPDLRRARAALSRLSYGPRCHPPVPGCRPEPGGRAWTRTRDLGLIRAAL